ncbi:MAG: ATP-binding protein [Acidobacteriota bacterium]
MDVEPTNNSQELMRLRAILQMHAQALLLGSMLGSLAHDLNNPLTAISGNIELLMLNPLVQDAKIKKRLDTVHAASKRMMEKLRYLQLFTKPGHGSELLELNPLVQGTQLVAESLPKLVKITIALNLSDETLMVMANPNQLAQALLAIINNALDAVQQTEKPQVKVGTRLTADQAVIFVANNGPQIDEQLGARIFEPFFTTKPLSVGLGLTLAQQMIIENNGQIDWHSTPTETEFSILLPRS